MRFADQRAGGSSPHVHPRVEALLFATAALAVAVGTTLRVLTSLAVAARRRHDRERRATLDPDWRRKALDDPWAERGRGPDDGEPEELVPFEEPRGAAPPPGRRPGP